MCVCVLPADSIKVYSTQKFNERNHTSYRYATFSQSALLCVTLGFCVDSTRDDIVAFIRSQPENKKKTKRSEFVPAKGFRRRRYIKNVLLLCGCGGNEKSTAIGGTFSYAIKCFFTRTYVSFARTPKSVKVKCGHSQQCCECQN